MITSISNVNAKRGEVISARSADEFTSMMAFVPASESLDYPTRLAQAPGGRGGMSARLHGYMDCPMELGATAALIRLMPAGTYWPPGARWKSAYSTCDRVIISCIICVRVIWEI